MADDPPRSATELLRWNRQQERSPSDGDSQAEQLAAESWQTVVSAIEAGGADDYLDELAHEEHRRDSPRESVLNAIESRHEG